MEIWWLSCVSSVSSAEAFTLTLGTHQENLPFLGYVMKENRLHWTGPKPENLEIVLTEESRQDVLLPLL